MSKISSTLNDNVFIGEDELQNVMKYIPYDVKRQFELTSTQYEKKAIRGVDIIQGYVPIKDLLLVHKDDTGSVTSMTLKYPNLKSVDTVVIDYQGSDYFKDDLTWLALLELGQSQIQELSLLFILDNLDSKFEYFAPLSSLIKGRTRVTIEFRKRGLLDRGKTVTFDRIAKHLSLELYEEYKDIILVTGKNFVQEEAWENAINNINEEEEVNIAFFTREGVFGDMRVARIDQLSSLDEDEKNIVEIVFADFLALKRFNYETQADNVRVIFITGHSNRVWEARNKIPFENIHTSFPNATIVVRTPPRAMLAKLGISMLPKYVHTTNKIIEISERTLISDAPIRKRVIGGSNQPFIVTSNEDVTKIINELKEPTKIENIKINIIDNETFSISDSFRLLKLSNRYDLIEEPLLEFTVLHNNDTVLFYSEVNKTVQKRRKETNYRTLHVNTEYFSEDMIEEMKHKLNVMFVLPL